MCWSLQACNFIKNRRQHRYFPKKIAKFLRTPIFANIYERSIFLVCSETIVLYYDCQSCHSLLQYTWFITLFIYFFQIFLLKRQSEKNFPIAALQEYEGKTITKIIRVFFNIYKFPDKKATFRSYAIKNVYFTFKFSLVK